MAYFSYTAQKSDGDIYKGVVQAADRFDLYRIIRREGGELLSYEGDMARRSIFSVSFWNAKLTTIPEQEKILFARNLGSMLHAGLPLSRALSVIERQTRNPRLRNATMEIESDVRHGSALHASLAKFPHIFSRLMAAMVRAGEEGGDLASSLLVTSEQMERASTLKKKIRGALLYPSVILIAIFAIGALMMIYVVPTLSKTFSEMGAKLPTSTLIIIGISNFLVTYTTLAFAGFAALLASIYGGLRTSLGRRSVDYMFLRLPVIGKIVREVNAARTGRTLASLLSAGVDMLAALDIASEVVQNYYFKQVIKDAIRGVRQGDPLSRAFIRANNLYPPLVGEMMAVGEETGQTAEMLKHLAEFYEAEVDRKTKDMSTIIEPFLMVFIGAAVGFFAISMISPIYQLSQSI